MAAKADFDEQLITPAHSINRKNRRRLNLALDATYPSILCILNQGVLLTILRVYL
jgi:hypothetical protein